MSDHSINQNSIDQVLKSIAENNVETVRVVFVDQHGDNPGQDHYGLSHGFGI